MKKRLVSVLVFLSFACAQLAMAEPARPAKGPRFTVGVDYVQPPYQRLKESFGLVSPEFAHVRPTALDIKVRAGSHQNVRFGYLTVLDNPTSPAVLERMLAMGVRAATYEELLAFAAANPAEQFKHPIVALGSSLVLTVGTDAPLYYAPVAMSLSRVRGLDAWSYQGRRAAPGAELGKVLSGWSNDVRFLVVQK